MSRKHNFTSWTPETSAKAHAAKAAKRMAGPPPDEWTKVPEGQHLGVLQWHAADGTVRRWAVCQGTRANNLSISAKGKSISGGWDKLFRGLRKHLSGPRRIQTKLIIMKNMTGIRASSRTRKVWPDKLCPVCGCMFPDKPTHTGKPRKYCDPSCPAVGSRLRGDEVLKGRSAR
jgi:hypothetical protein